MMEYYLGVKKVKAKKMSRGDYNILRGWTLPDDEDGSDEGYLVEHLDALPNHPDYCGYLSWSPTYMFIKAYRKIDGLTFGLALEAIKAGEKVARKGWNGKGSFISLQTPTELSKMTSPYIYIDTTGLQTDNPRCPKSLVPWLASQTDMLAEDWEVV
jgi:hypothetical protein